MLSAISTNDNGSLAALRWISSMIVETAERNASSSIPTRTTLKAFTINFPFMDDRQMGAVAVGAVVNRIVSELAGNELLEAEVDVQPDRQDSEGEEYPYRETAKGEEGVADVDHRMTPAPV